MGQPFWWFDNEEMERGSCRGSVMMKKWNGAAVLEMKKQNGAAVLVMKNRMGQLSWWR